MVAATAPSLKSGSSVKSPPVLIQALIVVFLGAVAAVPRFLAPELVPFGYDEALEALRARAIALGARPVANEVTSWLLPDPALMLYVYAIAEAFADPPIARTWLLGVLNTLSVVFAYWWGQSISGARLGFLTAGLYAVSPWAIYFGRQPWVNAQPVFTSLMLLSATRVVVHRDHRWSLPFFLALGLQMQTHLLGTVLALPAAFTVLLFWRAWGATVLVGALVVALINAPFALHVWELRESVTRTVTDAAPTIVTNHPLAAPRLAAWFVGGLELESKLVEGAEEIRALGALPQAVFVVMTGALLAGLPLAFWRAWRHDRGWQGYVLALIWVLTPLGAAMAQSRPVYIHYMTAIVPACFLLAALPFDAIARIGRPFQALSVVALGLIGAGHLTMFTSVLQGVRTEASLPVQEVSATERQNRLNEIERQPRQSGIGDLFGTSLGYWRDLGRQIRDISQQREINTVTVMIGQSDPYHLYVDRRRMALDYMLGTGITARFPFEGTTLLALENPQLALHLPGVEINRAVRNPERLLEVPLPGTRDETRLIAIPPRPLRDQSLGRRTIQARFSLGVQLVAYDSPQRLEPAEPVQITTYWTFEGLLDEARRREHSVFFHLLDSNGNIVAQSDGLGLPSSAWRSGDLLIRRTTFTLPEQAPERLVPNIGVYEQPTLGRDSVSLANGRVDDRVQLQPISIR